jgi:hypothetical protein
MPKGPCRSIAHHLILAHAQTVDIYRRDFKPVQKGIIGITLVSHNSERSANLFLGRTRPLTWVPIHRTATGVSPLTTLPLPNKPLNDEWTRALDG